MPPHDPSAANWYDAVVACLLNPAAYGWFQGIFTFAAVAVALAIATLQGRQLRRERVEARDFDARQELKSTIQLCRLIGNMTLLRINSFSEAPSSAGFEAQVGALREMATWRIPSGIERLPIGAAEAFLEIRCVAGEFGLILDGSSDRARSDATHWEAIISTRRTRVSDALQVFESKVLGIELA